MSKSKSKVKKNVHYSYETTDKRTFESLKDAEEWQEALDTFDSIVKLNKDLDPTDSIMDTFYVRIDNDKQLKVYNDVSKMEGLGGTDLIKEPGLYRYELSNGWINIVDEIYNLQDLLKLLKVS